MSRLLLFGAVLVVVGGCTGADSASTTGGVTLPPETPTTATTTTATTRTTTTIVSEPSRQGMVPAPDLILAAEDSGEISQLEADLYLSFAIFSAVETIPFEYLVPVAGSVEPQWDHSVMTRITERWDELDGDDQAELLSAVDGLGEIVDRSGVQDSPSVGGGDACIPVTAADVLVCVGESVSRHPVGSFPLDEAVAVIRPWVGEAVEDSWPKFAELFGAVPDHVKVFLSDLTATGGYTYDAVAAGEPETGSDVCHLYIDVMISGEADQSIPYLDDPIAPDGVPFATHVRATVAHELFHCFQQAAGLPGFDAVLWEGTATWAEHHIYPAGNTEIPWMTTWVADPGRPFTSRLYDTSFVFVFADLLGTGSSAITDVLISNSIVDLDPNFEDLWHQISVAAWNQEPVDPLVNDGGALIPAIVSDLGSIEITAETSEAVEFSLPLYSRLIETLVFVGGTSTQEMTDFPGLWLDLSLLPGDVRISALAETTDGWLDPVHLTGSKWQFCRMAIGPCNDADPAAIHPYTRIVLVVTNVDNGNETFSIPWNTFNPHLQGIWGRIDGPLLTSPGATAPYAIVGTELGFDEPGLVMTEDIEDFALAGAEPGWDCFFSGEYVVAADPTYGAADHGHVSGTVTVTDPTAGELFGNDCAFTSVTGDETILSGLNVPVIENPTASFGFEIRNYNTLWIYAFERIYQYERIG